MLSLIDVLVLCLCFRTSRILVQAGWPGVWYKDEGGRDKGLECTIRLINAEGKNVTGIAMPLKFLLTYEDDTPVSSFHGQ